VKVSPVHDRVARFFLVQHTKTGKNVPNGNKKTKTNDFKKDQTALKYTHIYH
jgi:hypothetical protein